MDRRSFLYNFGLASGGLVIACSSLGRRAEVLASGGSPALSAAGYGPLMPTAAKNTGEIFVSLPKGFEYNVIGRWKSQMSDGRPTPSLHDGMAVFKVGKELRLVRNHEISSGQLPREGFAIGSANHYDETAGSGTTTLIIDPVTRKVVKDFVSLSGTLINCGGGPTPWGSWISCEETTLGPTVRTNSRGIKIGGFAKPHGYCFEVPAAANSAVVPVPLKAMGRFVHEAVAVDGKTGVVYLTEDHATSGFYRFLPKRKQRLAEGGILQTLAVKDKPNFDTRTGQKQGVSYSAAWVTIDDPDPAEADVDTLAVYKQGQAKGSATFARLEGCCTDAAGRAYFTATSGGDNKGGQIWRYDPTGRDTGRLTLLYQSPSRETLDMPDNICVMPNSDLLFICEDSDYVGEGGTPDNFMRILAPNGIMADFAKNISADFPKSEFAGSTFSHDGKIFFVNLQQAGVTLAVWGDWKNFTS